MSSFLPPEEILAMCYPLTQPAAIRRWFRTEYKSIPVRANMPCGLPLIARSDIEQAKPNQQPAPNRSGLRALVNQRKAT